MNKTKFSHKLFSISNHVVLCLLLIDLYMPTKAPKFSVLMPFITSASAIFLVVSHDLCFCRDLSIVSIKVHGITLFIDFKAMMQQQAVTRANIILFFESVVCYLNTQFFSLYTSSYVTERYFLKTSKEVAKESIRSSRVSRILWVYYIFCRVIFNLLCTLPTTLLT